MTQAGTQETPEKQDWGWPWSPLALAVILGTALGGTWGSPAAWLVPATILVAGGMVFTARRRFRPAALAGLAALLLTVAGMTAARLRYTQESSVRQFLGIPSQLAQVRGRVAGLPMASQGQRGAFARFITWESPQVFLVLELSELRHHGRWKPCHGRLLVRLDQAAATLRPGERVEITGWLSAVAGPLNPGELDRRKIFERRGIDGRLTAESLDNLRRLGVAGPQALWLRWWSSLRAEAAGAAKRALHLGLREDPTRTALLDALLLGNRSGDLALVTEAFRATGLVHLLSISGAHLGILLLLVGLVAWRVVESPVKLTGIVLGVLGLYLLVLPMQVPIVRTAIMAVCLCLGWNSGRRVTGLSMVCLACVLVLLWKPGELWNPGFQLSYGLTAGLIAFTGPVSRMLLPALEPGQALRTGRQRLLGWTVGLLAANLVGFALAIPLVAYHFDLVSWIALPWAILAMPLVTAVIGLGFLKMVAGLIWPSLGMLLAPAAELPGQALLDLVQWGAGLPGAYWELVQPVSWAWTAALLAMLASIGLGIWRGRLRLALLLLLGLFGWLMIDQQEDRLTRLIRKQSPQEQARLHMLAVGEGDCILLRVPDPSRAGGEHTLLFDCGSRTYLDMGMTRVAPALRALGVRAIDTLMITHVDLDHLSGSIDLAQRLPIGRLLVSPQFEKTVRNRPRSPAAFLWRDFQARGIPIQIVAQGWRQDLGPVRLQLLWPPAEGIFARDNDASLVLSIQAGPKRVLLTGDIEEEAIRGLLSAGLDLRADVLDLPHHGSFHRAALLLLDAIQPTVVLQSCGLTRLLEDPWPQPLAQRHIGRRVTQRDGMISLAITLDGQEPQNLQWKTFVANAPSPDGK